MAEVTLKDLLVELRSQHQDNKKAMRHQLRDSREGIGKMTTKGVLGEAMLDRLKVRDVIRNITNFATLGIAPTIRGIRAASRQATENRKLYQSRVQALVEEGRSPADAAKIAKGAGDATEGSADQATVVNTSRIAVAVESIASHLGEYIKAFQPVQFDEPFSMGGSGSGSSDEDGGGDTAAVKKKSMISRFASAAGKRFGTIYEKGRKIDFRAGAERFATLGKSIVSTGRFLMSGLISLLSPLIAGLVPLLPALGVVLAGAATAALAVKAAKDAMETKEVIDKIYDEMRSVDLEMEASGRASLAGLARSERMSRESMDVAADLEMRRIAAARERGDTKIDIMTPSGRTFSSLGLDQAETLIQQDLKAFRGAGYDTSQTTVSSAMFERNSEHDQQKKRALSRAGDTNRALTWHETRSFSDTEVMQNELNRLVGLKQQGATKVDTIADVNLLYSPEDPGGNFLAKGLDIDSAIALAQQHLNNSRGVFLDQTRFEVGRRLTLEGKSRMGQILRETADDVAKMRPSKFEIYAKSFTETYSDPLRSSVGYVTDLMGNRIDIGPTSPVGVVNELTGVMTVGKSSMVRPSFRVDQSDVRNAFAETQAAQPIMVDQSNRSIATSNTNVEQGHMTDSSNSIREVQLAN